MERTGIEEGFVLVRDFHREYFGGNQGWFSEDDRPKVNKYGCGIIAAVNTYLYLAGITRVTKNGYMSLVDEFVRMYPLSRLCLNIGLGVLPWQMSSYIKRKCRAAGIKVEPDWQGRRGVGNLYEKMKQALSEDTPVIWAFYNLKPSHKIQFYKYINGEFRDTYLDQHDMEHRYDDVNSHYVTVTAVFESEKDGKLQRWVEISSWGSKYYVNYDEYKNFVRNAGGILNPLNLVNAYCSNILIIKKR
ncbi:hypothetical protein NXH64_11165 [Butyrivibrio fibrisolvens]|uniref:hypothetical protein n=1 Tax=Pseudobutyrivibrio ruminis TaxID=46206 RepID=UPI00040656D5|nr:hypothetical protein [Pseudobutyrivibrio ruminis]MDC7280058.1 hypothetical protein [Butyrivibrio fibrisolvens]